MEAIFKKEKQNFFVVVVSTMVTGYTGEVVRNLVCALTYMHCETRTFLRWNRKSE